MANFILLKHKKQQVKKKRIKNLKRKFQDRRMESKVGFYFGLRK